MVTVTSILDKDIAAFRVIHTDQNDVVVYNKKQPLILYNECMSKKKILNLRMVHYADNPELLLWDMTLTASKEIIASDLDNKRLIKISSSGRIVTLCDTKPLKPFGVCINNKQQIVVGLSDGYPVLGGSERYLMDRSKR